MNKIKAYLLLSSLVIVSCRHTNNVTTDNEKMEPHPPYFVNLEEKINKNKLTSIPLSSIGKEVIYVPLETKPISLLRHISQIAFSDSYIFISDFNRLLQFDRNGKFVRQVGANGRGPGEYIYVSGFCIDEKEEALYIIAWGTKTILEFGFDGRFVRSFSKPFESIQFLVKDTNSLVFRIIDMADVPDSSDFKLYITDHNGLPQVKIKNYNRNTSKTSFSITTMPLYIFKNQIQFMQFCVDTLYTLKNEKLEPYAIFNLGKLKINPFLLVPSQDVNEQNGPFKEKLWVERISENDKYLFLDLVYGLRVDSTKTCIINKINLETSFLKNKKFENDVDGGMNFWPRFVYNDSILVDYCDAYVFLNTFRSRNQVEHEKKYGDKYLQIEKLTSALDELSNPVLIIVKTTSR